MDQSASSQNASKKGKVAAKLVRAVSILLGGTSLLAFFAPRGLIGIMPREWTLGEIVAWDSMLSLAFFAQHSIMIRRSIRAKLERFMRPELSMAVYSIASGAVLLAVVLFWQSSGIVAWRLPAPAAWIARGLLLLTVCIFVWGILSLRPFDPFGVLPITSWLRGRRTPAPLFTIRGPHRWVRHPLYACMISILWLNPQPAVEVALCNVLWTAWVVLGAVLEERDLVEDFSDRYRRCQEQVPMLVPWRGRLSDRAFRSQEQGRA